MRLLFAVGMLLVLAAPASAATGRQTGLKLPARVQGQQIAVATGGRFVARFWPGMNLGATTPGHAPGELSPSRADYDRWLAASARSAPAWCASTRSCARRSTTRWRRTTAAIAARRST